MCKAIFKLSPAGLQFYKVCVRLSALQELDYSEDVLGLATTWPQAAASLPQPASTFDWEGDKPLCLPMEELVIYEMHVRGFTYDKSSKSKFPGMAYTEVQGTISVVSEVVVSC